MEVGQERCPPVERDEALKFLELTPQDTLIDYGCGDGVVLIVASIKYGCSGIGIEIDPKLAERARAQVAAFGLSNKIKIVTGDVRDFKPPSKSKAYAYLYGDLLNEIRPLLDKSQKVVTPWH